MHVLNEQCRRRLHLSRRPDVAARSATGRLAHQGRQGTSRCRSARHARGVRHHRPADRSRGSPAASPSRASPAGRRGAGRTAIRSSRIRRCSTRASTIRGSWGRQSFKTGYEYQAINTQIDDFNPKYGRDTYGGQFSRPADATGSDPATYNLADFMFGARNALFDHQSVHRQPAPADALRLPAGRLEGRPAKLTLNLGLRYEYATPQWEKDNFLTNFDPATNTLIQAKDGSIYDRALVNPDRNNFAPRVGLAFAVDRQDRHPLRLRHQLHPLQPHGRREPALLQRPARRRR